jgi:uncharacterized membrane protein YgcG
MSKSARSPRQRKTLVSPAPAKSVFPSWLVGATGVVLGTGIVLAMHQANPAILSLPRGIASLFMLIFTGGLCACGFWIAQLLGYSSSSSGSGSFDGDGDGGGDGGGD